MTNPLFGQITALEKQVWDALVTGDMRADAKLLDDDFIGVYPDGFSGKSDHTGQLATGPTVATYTLDNTELRSLGHDHVLITYRATFKRVSRPETEVMFVSSVWQRNDHEWVNIFSQDTPARNEA